MADLKPCPFCGTEMLHFPDYFRHPENGCILRLMTMRNALSPAWNRRAPSVTREVLAVKLCGLLGSCECAAEGRSPCDNQLDRADAIMALLRGEG